MTAPILYLGDTTLQSAAAYLAGLIHRAGWEFDYLPSSESLSATTLGTGRRLLIISDYPAMRIDAALQQQIVQQIDAGLGLLMIGGWESFQGNGGGWSGTPLADVLPVEVSTVDDRRNCDHVVLVQNCAEHPITHDLPWSTRPPVVGGFNRVVARTGATLLLQAQHFLPQFLGSSYYFEPAGTDPLLVTWPRGAGRVAALMTDLAPHWVGPLVDWGPARAAAQAPGTDGVEVGNLYAQFVEQLIRWTAGT